MAVATTQPKPAIGRIWRNGVTAAVVAAVINAILFYIGVAAGDFPADVITPIGQPITVVPVIGMSVLTIVLGTVGYTVLSRITANPNRWFIIATALVFIVMFISPIQLQSAGASLLMVVLLEIMHVVAAGSAIYFLTRS
ncbi:MAG: hypothetical protein DYG89_26780 [Caldilinea sp. CFX5]|nr:hypothetical protein [Caldilinea sp. CFX5]